MYHHDAIVDLLIICETFIGGLSGVSNCSVVLCVSSQFKLVSIAFRRRNPVGESRMQHAEAGLTFSLDLTLIRCRVH